MLEILEKRHVADHLLASALLDLATLRDVLGNHLGLAEYAAAEPLYRRALAIEEEHPDSRIPIIARCLFGLANAFVNMRDYAAAETVIRRALALDQLSLKSATGLSEDNIEWLKETLVQCVEAIAELNRANSLDDVAVLFAGDPLYDFYAAEAQFRRALEIRETWLGPHHLDVAGSLYDVAQMFEAMEDANSAEPLFWRALAIKEKHFGPDHLEVAEALCLLADLLGRQLQNTQLHEYAAAESLYRRALAIIEKELGPEHPHVAWELSRLADVLKNQAKSAAAEPLCRRALEIAEKYFEPEDWTRSQRYYPGFVVHLKARLARISGGG